MIVSMIVVLAALASAAQQPAPSPATMPAADAHPHSAAPATAPAEDSSDTTPAPIPAIALDFKPQQSIPGAPSSGAYMAPVECAPDGVPLVAFIDPADWTMPSLYALDPKGGHAYAPRSSPGLYDIHFVSYFASDSMVAVQVSATRDSTQSTRMRRSGGQPQTYYSGAHHEFLIEFDPNGSYKKTVDLPQQYDFRHIATLPDDTLLALSYDPANRVPLLLLLDSSGEIVRPLELPEAMVSDPAVTQGQSGNGVNVAKAASSLSWWLFGSARGRVLLYQARAHSPVLEVGAGGVTRQVQVAGLSGYTPSGVVDSNDRWIMQFRKDGLPDHTAVDTHPASGNFLYYEVDPNDGALRRRIDLPNDPFVNVACEHDGTIIGFIGERDKQVTPVLADLGR
jgi:hypothetical protein